MLGLDDSMRKTTGNDIESESENEAVMVGFDEGAVATVVNMFQSL